MNERNILDVEKPKIPITYHGDKSMKYLLRGFLFFIIGLINFGSLYYAVTHIVDLSDNSTPLVLKILVIISFLIAAIFGILGLYHLINCFRKDEMITEEKRSRLILLGTLTFLAFFLSLPFITF